MPSTLQRPIGLDDSQRPAPGNHDEPHTDFHPTVADLWLASRLLQKAGNPAIQIQLGDGKRINPDGLSSTECRSCGCLQVGDRAMLWKLAADPEFQFGEGYASGRIEVIGDLERFLCEVFRAQLAISTAPRRWFASTPLRRRNGSGATTARKNVARHYDLGNDFYRLWLDDQLVYTCAYFPESDISLEDAQIAKFEHVCRKLRLRPGDRVIEAGSGWGALALHMARHYGVTVRAFNLSHEQTLEARRRASAAGLTSQVEFIEDDWRNVTGQCDVFVSVGMLEHVGLKNYDQLGQLIHHSLAPSGRGLIHTIGLVGPHPLDAWTEQRIFPGAQPPSLSQLLQILEPHHLVALDVENLRLHYAETIRHWRQRFEQSVDRVRAMFDERFVRTWRLYLNSSIAAFETGSLQLFQVLFAPESNNDVPLTRAALYRNEATDRCQHDR